MKKNIKYMGIAAVALLAVAPIATQTISSATTVKADAVADGSATANDKTDANADTDGKNDASSNAAAGEGANAEVNDKANTNNDAKAQSDSSTVYSTKAGETDQFDGSNRISGTFPAMKDGKKIDISYNSVYVKGQGFDNGERVRMPNFKGYTVDQNYIEFKLQRNPKTNEITGITLPNGIPTYTKNGTAVSTSSESNEALQMSLIFSDGRGQQNISNSTDLTAAQKADAQKWESVMNPSRWRNPTEGFSYA